MEKPKYHFEFGRLLSEGIKQTALARQESLQQTHQYLADELGYAVNTLYVWRRGEHLPDDPHAVVGLARIFVKAWGADQQWINNFLAKGEYGPTQAIEKLNQELFGAESLPEEWGGAGQAKKDSAPISTPLEKVDADLFTPPQPALPSEQPSPEAAHRFVPPFRQLIQAAPDWLAGIFSGRSAARPTPATPASVALFASACGDKGLDLAEQRLLVSTAFGAYFAGLLERDEGYINLKGQIEVQTRPEQAGLEPIQSLYWALQHPKGPRLVIIAAEGGMGKSTLAAKLIRCLFEENAVDMIVGDSAKNQQVDPVSGAVAPIPAGYYDPASFFRRLYAQLGLPDRVAGESGQVMVRNIQGRLEGRRALILWITWRRSLAAQSCLKSSGN
ncbi:MAG: hypothetical protein HC875_39585 [Anaerolineales bacterium]|nr:hypothetical protein [Anaerolineales bacterium]